MANKFEFTYENVRQLQIKEMKSSSLTRLDPNFYESFIQHLSDLEADYAKLSNSGKNKTELVILGEEIHKLKSLLSSMYERRERKLIFLAQVEARGGQPNTRNLTDLERELYEGMVSVLTNTRCKIDRKSVEGGALLPGAANDRGIEDRSEPLPKSIGQPKPVKKEAEVKHNDHTTDKDSANDTESKKQVLLVQILQDDINFQDENARTYFLNKEDVITLPEQYAKILIKRGAAKEIGETN